MPTQPQPMNTAEEYRFVTGGRPWIIMRRMSEPVCMTKTTVVTPKAALVIALGAIFVATGIWLGVYLGEIWYLSELADWLRKKERNRFLLTAPPLRLPGAVGSPATPVATV